MPISDFNKKIKTAYQGVEVINSDNKYQVFSGNFYRRTVTINNTGKTPKTDYYVAIQINHWQIYLTYKSNDNFSDLRVYDSDGVTELDFFVQNQASDQTIIFVRIPNLPASSKDIYLEYGNNGLTNKSLNVLNSNDVGFWDFSTNKFKDWFIAQNCRRSPFSKFYNASSLATANGSNLNAFTFNQVQNWTNFGTKSAFGLFLDSEAGSFSYPLLNGHSGFGTDVKINNLDTVYFNNTRMNLVARTRDHLTGSNLDYNNKIFCAFVFRTGSTVTGATREILGSSYLSDTVTFRLTSLGQLEAVVTSEYNIINTAPLTANTNYLVLFRLDNTSGTNYTAEIEINGLSSSVSTSNASVSKALPFGTIGSTNWAGYIAEIMYFNEYNTNSSSDIAKRNEVKNYLNTKYKINNSSDFPIITVGSETNLNPVLDDDYISYNSLCSFGVDTENQNIFYGVENSSGLAKINKLLDKTVGNGLTNFTNSTLNSNYKVTGQFSRQVSLSTTPVISQGDIRTLKGSNNLHSLDKFEITDVVNSNNYISNDFDFLYFEINLENTDLDLSNCFLRFSDTTLFTNKKEVNFTGLTLSTGLNKIQFRKSDFATTGTLNWSDCIYLELELVLSTGSQTAYFGNFRLLKDYENIAKASDSVLTKDIVSIDNHSTFSSQVDNLYNISEIAISEKQLELKINSVLQEFYNSKFEDLPGFTEDTRIGFFAGKEAEPFDSEAIFKNKILKRIFCLAFPYDLLDFQNEPDVRISGDQNLYIARGDFIIKDYIEGLLKLYGAVIYFNPSTQKITYKTGFQTFYSSGLSLDSTTNINDSEIIEYVESTIDSNNIINTFDFRTAYRSPQIESNQYNAEILPRLSINPVELPAGVSTETFISLEQVNGYNVELLILLDYVKPVLSISPNSDGSGESGPDFYDVRILEFNFLDNTTLKIKLRNENLNARYLTRIGFSMAAYINYEGAQNSNAGVNNNFIYKNISSIKQFQPKQLDIKNVIISNSGADFNSNLQAFWREMVDKASKAKRKIKLRINKNPDININSKVKLKDKQNLTFEGFVTAIENYDSSTKVIEVTEF